MFSKSLNSCSQIRIYVLSINYNQILFYLFTAAANLITFTLSSVLHFGQIIITKSTTTDVNNEYLKESLCNEDFYSYNGTIADDNPPHDKLPQSQTFIVLFKREVFTKMHLKLSDVFSLYPPW